MRRHRQKLGAEVTARHILRYADPFFRSRNITVQQVTPALIQRYLDSLQEGRTKPLSGNTIKKHIVLLKSVFNESIKDGTLVYNPVRRIAPPKIVPYQAQTYSASELNELFEALQGSSIEDIVRVTAFYGLRRSEVCGLRWQDVDFEQNTIYIRHKVLETRINGQSEVMQTNELKTESSRRAFALVPTIRELLLKRRQWTEENRKLWGDCYDHTYDEYIFTLADGSLLTPERVSDRFRGFIERHGFKKIRFHDLRHPYVKYTTKIFSLRSMAFQAQAYPDARRKTRGACQLHRGGQSQSPVRPLCNRKRFS